MATQKRRWRVLKILPGAVLCVLGTNLLTLSSLWLTLCGLALLLLGIAAVTVALLYFGNREGGLYKRRNEILLGIGSTVAAMALFFGLSLAISIVPQNVRDTGDAELGWGPPDDPERVGMRGDVVDRSKQHILVIGDSITYGHGVAPNETIPAYLGQEIPSLQTLNLSVSGYSIDQEYLYLEREIGGLNPRVVVMGVYSGNDFQLTAREYGWSRAKPFYEVRDGALFRTNPNLLENNCINDTAQSFLFSLLWSDHARAQGLLNLFCQPKQLEAWDAEEMIGKLFEATADVAREHNVPILFVMLPDRMNFAGDEPDGYYINFVSKYKDLKKMLVDRHYDVMEIAPAVARSGLPFDEIFLDQGHYRGRGAQIVAHAIADDIRARYGIQ